MDYHVTPHLLPMKMALYVQSVLIKVQSSTRIITREGMWWSVHLPACRSNNAIANSL